MTNLPTPPFKVQKFRERWERIDRTTGETHDSGWSGHALYRVTYADKTVGIFSTGTDQADTRPAPGGYDYAYVQVLDDTLPDLEIHAVWVATITKHTPLHGGATLYKSRAYRDLSVDITDPTLTRERLEDLRAQTLERLAPNELQRVLDVKILAGLKERIFYHEPHH